MTPIIIDLAHPARDRCPLCKCLIDKAGYPVEDDQGSRSFLCHRHLGELIAAGLGPLKTVAVEA